MRICYPFVLNPTGGSFTSTKLLIENLDEKFNCQFVFGMNKSAAQHARKSGINTKILPVGDSISNRISKKTDLFEEVAIGVRMIPYLQNIRQYLKNESVDLVHTNDGPTTMIWGVAAKTIGVPVVWHVRSERSNEWDRFRLKICDHIIFVAESNKQRFCKSTLKEVETSVIHNGVDLSSFTAKDSMYLHEELGLHGDTRIVGFVGNLVARKRPMLFVSSALEVLKKDGNVHFVIVGEDQDHYTEKILNRFQERGLENNISLLGYRNDVNEIMPSLDLLVLTSTEHGEGFPRVPLEAMACGTPVVTTDTAGVSEAVTDGRTGFVLGPDPSPEEMCEKIRELLLNENLLNEFAIRAELNVRNNFSAEKYSDKVRSIYDQI